MSRTPRANVTEVRRVHRATRRGFVCGLVAGAGAAYGGLIGAAVGASYKTSTVVYRSR